MKKARRKNNSLFLLVGALVVVAAVIFIVASSGQNTNVHAESGVMIKMTTAQVEEWLEDKSLAFVEFYSPECSACQMAEPVLKKLVAEKNLNFAYVDVRYPENRGMMSRLGVNATPTIIVFANGRVVEAPVVGFLGEAAYRDFFDRMLAKYSGS